MEKNYFKAGEMIYHAPEDRYDCSNNIRGRQRYENCVAVIPLPQRRWKRLCWKP